MRIYTKDILLAIVDLERRIDHLEQMEERLKVLEDKSHEVVKKICFLNIMTDNNSQSLVNVNGHLNVMYDSFKKNGLRIFYPEDEDD